nr:MAG TPA: hypothetical protein [Caudoviricetes sp.]
MPNVFCFFMPLGSSCCQVFFMLKSRILVSLIEIKVTKTLYNFHKITMVSLVTRTLLIKARAMAFCRS